MIIVTHTHTHTQEIKDLQDQVKDLMFYLETQQKISQAPEGTKQVCMYHT